MNKKESKAQSPTIKRRNKILQWWFFIGIGLGIIISLGQSWVEGVLWWAIGWAVMGVILALIVAVIVNAVKKEK